MYSCSPPTTSTPCPGGSIVIVWLKRASWSFPVGRNFRVRTSKISAESRGLRFASMPPATSTFPESRSAAACSSRAACMIPVMMNLP